MLKKSRKNLFGIVFGLMVGAAGATAFIAACDNGPSNAMAHTDGDSNWPQFIGITAVERDGGAGFGVLNSDCNDTYPGSRMCTDTQLVNSFPAPQPSSDAWVLMTVASTSFFSFIEGGDPHFYIHGKYGHMKSNGNTNCSVSGLFNQTSSDGLVLTSSGNMELSGCATPRRTACCGF